MVAVGHAVSFRRDPRGEDNINGAKPQPQRSPSTLANLRPNHFWPHPNPKSQAEQSTHFKPYPQAERGTEPNADAVADPGADDGGPDRGPDCVPDRNPNR